MRSIVLALLMPGLLLFLPLRAAAAPPSGTLGLSLHGHALVARLTLPAPVVVGFDHAPVNATERLAVRAALARLGEARNVLVPAAAAQCRITRQEARTALLPPPDGAAAADVPGDHDFHGHYTWHCANPDALAAVALPLLEYMNGVALNTLVVTAEGRRERLLDIPGERLPVPGHD